MLKTFDKKKYKIIKKAVSKEMASFLTDYYFLKQHVATKLFLDGYITADRREWGAWIDSQNKDTYSCYGDISSETLLLSMLPLIEKHSGRKLLPTYSYMRIYKKGDVLADHRDRESCEISATLNLSGEKWPIFFKDGDKPSIKVSLKPGDLAIYKGCELNHWREAFEGEHCAQVFLHYTSEKNKHLEFDGRGMPGLPGAYGIGQPFRYVQDQTDVHENMDILKKMK